MSAVIKINGAERLSTVRPIATASRAAAVAPVIDPQVVALEEELARLHHRLREQEAEIAEHGPALRLARQQGEEAGRKVGREEVEDQQAARVAAITGAAQDALKELSRSLAALEEMAPAIALAALTKMLGSSDDRGSIVRDLIAHQLSALKDQAVVRAEVSAHDFDAIGLEQLKARLGGAVFEATASQRLEPGDCRLVLKLGALELGLNQQLSRLHYLLGQEGGQPGR